MPDGWVTTTIGAVAAINPESVRDTESDRIIRYVDLSAVSAGRGIDTTAVAMMPVKDAPGRARRVVRDGDVLIATVRPYLRGFAVVPKDLDGEVASTGFAVLRARREKVLPGYLWATVTTDKFVDGLMARATGSNYPAVRPGDVADQPIDLPPLAEQRRIVDLIGAVDRYRSACAREASAALAALSTAREEWITWEVTEPLATLCSIESALVDPGDVTYAHLPHIGIDAIQSRTGRLLATRSASEDGVTSGKFIVDEADVVYSKIRPELRKATFPAMRALCSADAYPLRPKPGVDPNFLLEVLLTERFSEIAIGRSGRTKMPKVNRSELLSIPVPWPTADEQREVGERLRAMRLLLEVALRAQTAASQARATLLKALLLGSTPLPASYDRFLDGAA